MIYFNEEEVKKAYERSDSIIKTVVSDSWVAEDVALIGKKFSIRIDRIDIIVRLVAYIILNLLPMSKFIDSIVEETGIERGKATEVAKKINDIIFLKIRELIREGKEINAKKEELKTQESGKIDFQKEEEKSFSLIDDVKKKGEMFGDKKNGEKKDSFKKMLEESQSSQDGERKIDPYREAID